MYKISRVLTLLLAAFAASGLAGTPSVNGTRSRGAIAENTRRASLWSNPQDITARNLFYGPGGKEHQPKPPFTFVKEDLDGTNPKYVVTDAEGVKWNVKLGQEAQPETVASRLVWAVGYFANEEYFLTKLRVNGMPAKLHRGGKYIGPDGTLHNARLKRHAKGEEKVGEWKWREEPFLGTRELNGLRVMMALMNNWDLKDVNNAVYETKQNSPRQIFMVSDLGATFGTPGVSISQSKSKGNLEEYAKSKFITKVREENVDFKTPARPTPLAIFKLPTYLMRVKMVQLGKRVPREDCRWIGQLLGRLSPGQIRDAFRSAGYSPQETEAYSRVVETRISALRQL